MSRTACCVVLLSVVSSVLAQEDPGAGANPARQWIGGAPFSEWTRLSGDWGGLRTKLEDAGIEVSGGYTCDLAAPWSGDTRRRSSLSSLLDVNVAFDLEALAGLPRTLAYVDAYRIAGRDPSNDVGDFQALSNIQAENTAQVAEVWLETWIADRFRLKAGKVDFNSEFAFHEIGSEFANSTAAIPPTIVAYPTYPDPAMAVNVFYVPDETFYVGVGLYDGAGGDGISTGGRGPKSVFSREGSDSWFLALEVGKGWAGGESWGSGRACIGAYHHTATFATFDGGTDEGTEGAWATIEQRLWRENAADDDGQGFGGFLTLGFADESVSACGLSVALGVEWIGLIPGRDFDAFALGLFHCDMSDDPGAGTAEDETVFEALYKVQVTPAISVKPELQYIAHPGGATDVDDVLVGLLRIEILF